MQGQKSANAPEGKWLFYFEAITVGGLVLFIIATIVFLLLWVFFGWGSEIHDRLTDVIKLLNDNWKVTLLILLPLFFRPLRKFLVNLRKGPFGTESGDILSPHDEPTSGEYKK